MVRNYERAVTLQSIDTHWREHLAALDYLRQGIHLRGYAQKQPKQRYKREAFELFGAMLDSIKREVTRHLLAVQVRSEGRADAERRAEEAAHALKNVTYQHADPTQQRLPKIQVRKVASRHRGWWLRRDTRRRQRAAVCSLVAEGRSQRSVSLRVGQEIQTVPREIGLGDRPRDSNEPGCAARGSVP